MLERILRAAVFKTLPCEVLLVVSNGEAIVVAQLQIAFPEIRVLIEGPVPGLSQRVQGLNGALCCRIGGDRARQIQKDKVWNLAALPVVAEEKEMLIFLYRAADAAAELVEVIWR